jgi:hypothetical protein
MSYTLYIVHTSIENTTLTTAAFLLLGMAAERQGVIPEY